MAYFGPAALIQGLPQALPSQVSHVPAKLHRRVRGSLPQGPQGREPAANTVQAVAEPHAHGPLDVPHFFLLGQILCPAAQSEFHERSGSPRLER